MPTYPHIERYHADKERLIAFGGSDNELNIRPAFQNCLSAYCGDHRERLALVPELPVPGQLVPDGTVKDSLRLARGYWEAKDTHDDLDTEIQRKLDRGYPQDNIIFEDSRTAVLMRTCITNPIDWLSRERLECEHLNKIHANGVACRVVGNERARLWEEGNLVAIRPSGEQPLL